MSRRLYLVASILWALVLGPIVGFAVVGFSAGVAWLYIFGDNPWPASTQSVLALLGICAGLLTVIVIIGIGYNKGKRGQSSPHPDPIAERNRAITLLVVPLLLILLAASTLWIEGRNYRQAMNAATIREATFADLVGANKKIVEVTIGSSPDGITQAVVRLSGQREGTYHLNWRVSCKQ